MPELTPFLVGGVILLGGVVGFLSGLFGVGGGFLLTPMLNIAFGVPMNVAIGSGLCQMIGTATTATIRHWKESAVDVKLALIMLGGTIGGVEIGTQLLEHLKHLGRTELRGREFDWVWLVPMTVYVVLLLVVGVSTFYESFSAYRKAARGDVVRRRVGRGLFNRFHFPPMTTLAGTEGRPVPLLATIYLGFGVGVLQGFLGLGGGIILLPALIYWVGCSTRMAVGTSLFIIVISAMAGTVSHALRDNVSLPLVALVLVSSTVGAYVGAEVHHRLKAHHVRLYFSCVVFAALAVIVVKMAASFGLLG